MGLNMTGFSGGNIAFNVQSDVEGHYAGLVALHNGFEQIGGDVKLLGKGYPCFYLETKSGTKYLDDEIFMEFSLAAKGDAITNVTGKVELGGDYESVYDGKQNTYTINKDEGKTPFLVDKTCVLPQVASWGKGKEYQNLAKILFLQA